MGGGPKPSTITKLLSKIKDVHDRDQNRESHEKKSIHNDSRGPLVMRWDSGLERRMEPNLSAMVCVRNAPISSTIGGNFNSNQGDQPLFMLENNWQQNDFITAVREDIRDVLGTSEFYSKQQGLYQKQAPRCLLPGWRSNGGLDPGGRCHVYEADLKPRARVYPDRQPGRKELGFTRVYRKHGTGCHRHSPALLGDRLFYI